MSRRLLASAAFLLLGVGALSCGTLERSRKPPPPPPPPSPVPTPGEPLTPVPPSVAPEEPYLPVEKVPDPIVVAAWAEPKRLPRGGGQAQILVRIQKRGGRRYAGVQVRLVASEGTLYSKGNVLVTDSQGMTRDRLTTRKTSTITLNAGGTRYRFQVPVGEAEPPER
jgi:hypothetical protein